MKYWGTCPPNRLHRFLQVDRRYCLCLLWWAVLYSKFMLEIPKFLLKTFKLRRVSQPEFTGCTPIHYLFFFCHSLQLKSYRIQFCCNKAGFCISSDRRYEDKQPRTQRTRQRNTKADREKEREIERVCSNETTWIASASPWTTVVRHETKLPRY